MVLREYCSIKRDIEPYDVSIIECVLCGGVTGREYKQLVELQDNAATTHYFWGQLHDRVYSAQRSGLCLPATLTARAISDVQEAIRHFSLSLQQSDTFLYHSIIRVTTLWFRVSQESAVDLMATVKEMTEIKSYQWYVVLQQLVSVAQHPCELLKRQVSSIIATVLREYTEFVVWQIIGMLNNDAGVKRSFMMPVDSNCGGDGGRSSRTRRC